MKEEFEGPLEIENEVVVERVVKDFAGENDLDFFVECQPTTIFTLSQPRVTDYARGVEILALLRKGDKLLFFVPYFYHYKYDVFVLPPNEKSLLFPLEALYKLSPDEQRKIIMALLEAAWKEAKLMNKDDPVELLKSREGS
ncbi:MAG: hypothetical protein Q8R29_03150 [bacterium]|nr:hypothetical protein [bacterium]